MEREKLFTLVAPSVRHGSPVLSEEISLLDLHHCLAMVIGIKSIRHTMPRGYCIIDEQKCLPGLNCLELSNIGRIFCIAWSHVQGLDGAQANLRRWHDLEEGLKPFAAQRTSSEAGGQSHGPLHLLGAKAD